jgi:hypothetical protein
MKASDVLELKKGDKLVWADAKGRIHIIEFFKLSSCTCENCSGGKTFRALRAGNDYQYSHYDVEKLSDIIKE